MIRLQLTLSLIAVALALPSQASDENERTFTLEPARYEPGYGGWCAYAMSKGATVQMDPDAFLVQGGRLLLFETKSSSDEWSASPDALEKAADTSWAKLLER